MTWDIFISHASDDKASVARPLTKLLGSAGLKVWLDANELTLGDSLSRKIDEGLAHSNYGVVILSRHFFRKSWPTHELAGLVARQIGGHKVILPVWHEIDRSFVLKYSPTLADAMAVSTADGLELVAREIVRAVNPHHNAPPHEPPASLSTPNYLCPVCGKDVYGGQPYPHDNRTLFFRCAHHCKAEFWIHTGKQPPNCDLLVLCPKCLAPSSIEVPADWTPGSEERLEWDLRCMSGEHHFRVILTRHGVLTKASSFWPF